VAAAGASKINMVGVSLRPRPDMMGSRMHTAGALLAPTAAAAARAARSMVPRAAAAAATSARRARPAFSGMRMMVL
jgi:hypothetical protein